MSVILSVPYIIWLILSALFFATGEFFSKKFGLEPSWYLFGCIMMSYIIGTIMWLPAIISNNQLSIVGAIWSVLSLMATVLIGVVLFNEHLSTLAIFGIVLGLASVLILSVA